MSGSEWDAHNGRHSKILLQTLNFKAATTNELSYVLIMFGTSTAEFFDDFSSFAHLLIKGRNIMFRTVTKLGFSKIALEKNTHSARGIEGN